MPAKRLLIISSYAKNLIHFRGDYMKSLLQNNYEVFAAAPNIDTVSEQELRKLGTIPIEIALQRTGLNPFKDIGTLFQIRQIIKKHEINIVFPYTIKPVVYGSLAARMAGIPVISMITGLGFTFSESSRKARVLKHVTELLYKIALRKNRTVIFQNSDDLHLFQTRKLLNTNQKVAIIDGSGVNLDKYPFRVKNNISGPIVFITVARLIEEKGINLFIDAAEKLKTKYPYAEFHVIGSPDKSPSAIKMEKIEMLHRNNIIVYHGLQKNVPDFLSNSDVFVLPTFYREGIPRSILEALSIGMPIITTDTPGCRETIEHGANGLLIKPRNLEDLVEAMAFFIENREKIKEMGLVSRDFAENKFDVNIINKKLLKILEDVA